MFIVQIFPYLPIDIVYLTNIFLLIIRQETWRSCKGASGISPDHGMPALDYKWQRHHSHSRSFSSSHFDEVKQLEIKMLIFIFYNSYVNF